MRGMVAKIGTVPVNGYNKGDKKMTAGIVKLFATVLALIGPAPAHSPKEFQLQSGQRIVAIGDSITGEGSNRDTGFVRVIDAVLAKQYPDMKLPKVINAGMGGQRSDTSCRGSTRTWCNTSRPM